MKIQIVTVVVGVSEGRGWILTNLLEGLKKLSLHVDIHLNVIISSVPSGTEWGLVPECDFSEINRSLNNSTLEFTIWSQDDLIFNPKYDQTIDPDYPSTGESHSKVLDDTIWTLSRNFSDDFLLIMDYDSFFIPSEIPDFLRILSFSKDQSVVFGCIDEEIKIKEIYKNSKYIDYNIQENKAGKIERGDRSIIYLPRIHPLFVLFTKKSLLDLTDKNDLHFYPLKTIGVFDDLNYILYGDCGVFLMNVINKKTGVTWILKSPEDMPVNHYRGMTLSISRNEKLTRIELENIFKDLYHENNKNSLG